MIFTRLADGAISRPMRRLSDLGLSCLWNEAYGVKTALDAGRRPCEKELGKWREVAVFSNGLPPFQDTLMRRKASCRDDLRSNRRSSPSAIRQKKRHIGAYPCVRNRTATTAKCFEPVRLIASCAPIPVRSVRRMHKSSARLEDCTKIAKIAASARVQPLLSSCNLWQRGRFRPLIRRYRDNHKNMHDRRVRPATITTSPDGERSAEDRVRGDRLGMRVRREGFVRRGDTRCASSLRRKTPPFEAADHTIHRRCATGRTPMTGSIARLTHTRIHEGARPSRPLNRCKSREPTLTIQI
jgi:hypothetical protein